MPVSILQYIVVSTPEGDVPIGNPAVPTVIEGDDLKCDKTVDVAASTTVTLFTAGTELADFDFLAITVDGDVMLELSTDINNGVGDENFTVQVTEDCPFILGSDTSYANYTVNFGAGALDLIERIRCRNLGTSTVRVRILLYT